MSFLLIQTHALAASKEDSQYKILEFNGRAKGSFNFRRADGTHLKVLVSDYATCKIQFKEPLNKSASNRVLVSAVVRMITPQNELKDYTVLAQPHLPYLKQGANAEPWNSPGFSHQLKSNLPDAINEQIQNFNESAFTTPIKDGHILTHKITLRYKNDNRVYSYWMDADMKGTGSTATPYVIRLGSAVRNPGEFFGTTASLNCIQ